MTGPASTYRYYSAETSPKGFWYYLPRFPQLVGETLRHKVLLRQFVGRELRSRFHGSFMGAGWVLLQPLFLFVVYYVVFGELMGRWEGGTKLLFALYLFSGLTCFHGISGATNTALNSVVGNANLVKKVAFPSQLLPLVPVLVEVCVFAVGLVVVLGIGIGFGALDIGWELLLLPWFLLIMIGFMTGLGLLLANIMVFARDVKHVFQVFTTAWFFGSPNFWWPNFIRDMVEPKGVDPDLVLSVLAVNPIYHLLIGLRQVLGFTHEEIGYRTDVFGSLGIATAWAVFFLAIGYGTFMKHKGKYADLI